MLKAAYEPEQRVVYYIMGTGRSGTTILDILLSNNEGVMGCGEITHVFEDAVLGADCACGVTVKECQVWQHLFRNIPESERGTVNRLIRSMESHGSFLAVFLGLKSFANIESYHHFNEIIYTSLFDRGYRAVVDSSKYASRALLLSAMLKDRLKIICLTRSPEGLINSFSKQNTEQPSKSVVGTFMYYIYSTICFALVRIKLADNLVLIRYEDMVADPLMAISNIENALSIELGAIRHKLNNHLPLDAGHIAVGNRLRKQKPIFFKTGCRRETVRGSARLAVFVMRCVGKLLGFDPYSFKRSDS